ncbi:UbiA family prenyltransferase [Belnapia sp. T6]|uniref:UbiA family prenyltransferase n=1 Tax=Belnapia mucosa TaxID=2804532 RepID=A0ABS1V0C1_9PROT|nr:UbiA family prenyltransferase [Belnapia mucosa]MBL6455007.1 UbiA family prenyltransferase [Belnapia mucosa]
MQGLRTSPTAPETGGPLPLAVDLDGTLLATDTLHEGLVDALLHSPAAFPGLLRSLPQGRAAFKRRVSRHAPADAANLPLRQPFLDWLKEQHDSGRELHLVTAADQAIADAIAAHVGLFRSATGSDGTRNLRSEEKAEFLRRAFPDGFAYAGDSRHDLPVFAAATEIVLVNASPATAAAARAVNPAVIAEFPPEGSRLSTWLSALRIHQWSKNVLVLVPLLLGHKLGDATAILHCVLGMLLLSLAASGTYLLNDLADLSSDRMHRKKRHRAIASGRIRPLHALAVATGLIVFALLAPLLFRPMLSVAIIGYCALSLLYSGFLKRIALIDTLTIAGLFTMRLSLGIELADVPYSPWLVAFAGFFFFSLALAKRHCELMEAQAGNSLARRGWEVEDWPLTLGFGAAAGMSALIIMILFVADDALPSRMYSHPAWLYVAPGAVAVWLMRIWLLAHRRRLQHDPVVFALRDPASWGIGAVVAAAIVMAL